MDLLVHDVAVILLNTNSNQCSFQWLTYPSTVRAPNRKWCFAASPSLTLVAMPSISSFTGESPLFTAGVERNSGSHVVTSRAEGTHIHTHAHSEDHPAQRSISYQKTHGFTGIKLPSWELILTVWTPWGRTRPSKLCWVSFDRDPSDVGTLNGVLGWERQRKAS